MERRKIEAFIAKALSPQRFDHCLRVENTALNLATKFGVDPEAISAAALLHDLCREESRDSLLNLAANFAIVIDDIEQAEPLLLHGAVAAARINLELGITDPEILEAVAFHITGVPKAAPLTNLIFIADFIEPGRPFKESRILRELALDLDPDQLLLRVYNRTINYVVNNGYLLHPYTSTARNDLLLKGVKETAWNNC